MKVPHLNADKGQTIVIIQQSIHGDEGIKFGYWQIKTLIEF